MCIRDRRDIARPLIISRGPDRATRQKSPLNPPILALIIQAGPKASPRNLGLMAIPNLILVNIINLAATPSLMDKRNHLDKVNHMAGLTVKTLSHILLIGNARGHGLIN